LTVEANPADEPTTAAPVVDQQLVAELVARAAGQGLSVTGEGGLLRQVRRCRVGSAGDPPTRRPARSLRIAARLVSTPAGDTQAVYWLWHQGHRFLAPALPAFDDSVAAARHWHDESGLFGGPALARALTDRAMLLVAWHRCPNALADYEQALDLASQ
jgi:hypothetical protein